METYTFVAHFRGGCYLSQYSAPDLSTALNLWGEGLDKKVFSVSQRKRILRDIEDPDYFPVLIDGLDNIWESDYLSGKFFLILYIVATS